MQAIKELIDDLGGGRVVSVISLVVTLAGITATQWVSERETTEQAIAEALRRLELNQTRIQAFIDQGPRFTTEDAKALEKRLDRLERVQDQLLHALREERRSGGG